MKTKNLFLLFLSIINSSLIFSQCNAPVLFPASNSQEGGVFCLEGIPSPYNDICIKNNSGSLNFIVNSELKYNFDRGGNFIEMMPTAGDAIIRRGNSGNLIINSSGDNSSLFFNYAFNGGKEGINIFDGGTTNFAKLWITKGNSSSGLNQYGGNLVLSPSGGKVIITNYGNNNIFNIPDSNYKLIVQNGILTEKLKVAVRNSTQWSDHVFDEKYSLKPLEEVEKYIKENKHLPNIPSSEELVKEGLDLGEMQAKQMEKIEELTLYLIEMKKEINALKKENQELKEAIIKK